MVHGAVEKLAAKTGLSAHDALAAILRDAGQPRLVTADEVAAAVLAFALPTTTAVGETRALMGADA
jgi:DNA-binding phage protein